MKKLILFFIIFCCVKVNAQVYQLMPQYGYQAPRFAIDSTLQIPTVCGVPTLKSVQFVTKKGAIAYDSCNAIFYTYNPKTQTWSAVTGGGGGATDTTSLSNRINLKLNISDTASMLSKYLRKTDTTNKFVNSITRTEGKDSIIYFVGANRFAIKDSVGTNPAPVGYYGAFQDTTTQTAASINTAYPVNLRVTDLSNGITISNNSKIKIANAGIYNIQFSLQLEKTGGSGNMIADIWLRKNGVNIDGTTGKVVLTGSANASPVVAAWNYVVAVSSNDSLELMWATSNDNVVIKASPATSPHPSIPSAILTVTQQSGIMAGTGISPLDTANMLLPYLRKIDTTYLSNRIDLKLSTADTSVFQRKSLSAYSIMANNTSATANATAQYFKDTSGTYTGTITWNGTAPTSGTFSYRWTRIGKMVILNISLVYANAGLGNTQVVVTLPADAPTPTKPAGLTSASNMLYPAVSNVNITNQSTLTSATIRSMMRSNSGNNGFEFLVNFVSNNVINTFITCTYFTD